MDELTPEEKAMVARRREKQAVNKQKVAASKALTGLEANYPFAQSQVVGGSGLQHGGEHGLPRGPEMEAESSLARRFARQGGGSPLRPLRSYATEAACPRYVGPDVRVGSRGRPRRPPRGLSQRMKVGVTEALGTMKMLRELSEDDGRWLLLELFAGSADLTERARQRPQWKVLEPVDVLYGLDLLNEATRKKVKEQICMEKPDLVTIAPPCGPWSSWTNMCLDAEALWEKRRSHLPFRRFSKEVWEIQYYEGRLALVEQPVRSQALELSNMQARPGVHRVVVPQCFFGLRDPVSRKPYQKLTSLDVTDGVMAERLCRGVKCCHRPGEHEQIQGAVRVEGRSWRRSTLAARWPRALCDRILDAAEEALRGPVESEVCMVGLAEATEGECWEAVPVSHASFPEETLRRHFQENAISGERYDYVTFDGSSTQQPRRLRSMVAHLHVVMGHLSNERLARMLVMSGAQESIVQLARRHVLQDQWVAVFGPPDHLMTDGGPEFAGEMRGLSQLFGIYHEVVPEGAHWRLGQVERHGAVVKLMMMRMIKAMDLKGLDDLRQSAWACFGAKNRTCNRAGVTPMQAVTGRNTLLPGSLMNQLASGKVRFSYNHAASHEDAIRKSEKVRAGAMEAYHWLDAHDSLRRSRPPNLEGIREGATVCVYEPPPSRRGLARRLQDDASWSGPGIVVCVERDRPVPHRIWVRIRGKVKSFPLEKIRLATVDEMVSAEFITDALKEVQRELQGGRLAVEETGTGEALDEEVMEDDESPTAATPLQGSGAPASASSSRPQVVDPEEAERRARRTQLLEDLPTSIQKNFEERRKREMEAGQDPYEIEFQRKRKLFDKLTQELGAPTPLQEAQLRSRMEENYNRVRQVRKTIRAKPKNSGGRRRASTTSGGRGVYVVEDVDLPETMFTPGEIEAMLHDTMGYQVLWSQPSGQAGKENLEEVGMSIQRAEADGISEVTTGKARIEYKWGDLGDEWQRAFVGPLCKAIDVYLEHQGIRGVPKEKFVDPTRILSSRFVLTNKGGSELSTAELKARWIFGGHRDPDAGKYPTSSPTASMLGHNLVNFVAVQNKWTIYYEDVSAAFLQGKDLPREGKV